MSSFLPALIGGVVSGYGQYRANKETKNYLTRMSNTGYQRAMADMKAAGLNPMLAAKLGPASTPNYQAGNVGGAAVSGFNQGAAASSAIASARQSSAMTDQIREQTKTIVQSREFQKVVHDERWAKTFASMSAENVVASAQAALRGIPLEETLKGFPSGLLPKTRKNLELFVAEVQAMRSTIRTETLGTAKTMEDAWNATKGAASDAWKFGTEQYRFIVEAAEAYVKAMEGKYRQ